MEAGLEEQRAEAEDQLGQQRLPSITRVHAVDVAAAPQEYHPGHWHLTEGGYDHRPLGIPFSPFMAPSLTMRSVAQKTGSSPLRMTHRGEKFQEEDVGSLLSLVFIWSIDGCINPAFNFLYLITF